MTHPEPHWLGRLVVDEAHFRQIREHGGAYGIRDENGLEAALARPRQRWSYQGDTSLSELAAAYAYGLVHGHPYVDGNKRVGLVVMVAFLERNGFELTATNSDALSVIFKLAADTMTEAQLAEWIDRNSRPL